MLRCSHILCKVDDISGAVSDFSDLGFEVTWGSASERAYNALIWFDSGPFVELFELPSAVRLLWPAAAATRGRAFADRLARWAAPGQGWRDVALETEGTDLATARSALRGAGVPVSPVVRGGRTRPDGERVSYGFLAPRPSRLPFVVSAYDPPQRPARTVHPNGATGISRVHLRVADSDRPRYERLVGDDPWLRAAPGPAGVGPVEVAGLDSAPDPSLCRGAVLVPAGGTLAL